MGDYVEFVRPSLPPLPGLIKLPPLDQLATNRYVYAFMFAFSLPSLHAKEDAVFELSAGLQATLDEMPFLAANIVADDTVRGSIQLEIPEDDNVGIKFHVKDMSNLYWNDLAKSGFPTAQLRADEFTAEPRFMSERTPVLTVQANFITGGLLLAINFNHAVFDGHSVLTLLTRWAKHTATAATGNLLPLEDRLLRATSDRLMLFRGHNTMALSEFPYYRAHTYSEGPKDYLLNKSHGLTHSDYDVAFWRPTDESLVELERLVCGARGSKFSTNAFVGAFIWQRVTKARQLSARGEATTSFLFPVNVRDILVPSLPPTQIGNIIVGARATASVADMEASGPEFLYTLAERITEAKNWWTSDRVLAWMGAWNACPDLIKDSLHFDTNLDTFLGTDIVLTNMSSTQFNLDWGSTLGRIKALRPTSFPSVDGIVSLLVRFDGKGLEFAMGFATETMKRLAEDELWIKMMTLVCSEQLGD
ncbi:hypothetical protein N0V90_012492 [Kalmusia sp. IMI 367209]|nr:hypothetical protein N0V90_012492 [Kalmusia sp. IMI 367209]